MKRWVMAGQILLAILCIGWLYRTTDWRAVWAECSHISLPMFCLVFAQRYLPYLALGLRLKLIFPARATFFQGLQASLLCVGSNNVIPGRGGELIKIFWLKRHAGIKYPNLFAGVFLERLLDVSMLLLLGLIFARSFLNFWVCALLALSLAGAWGLLLWLGRHPEKIAFLTRHFTHLRKFWDWLGEFLKFSERTIYGARFLWIFFVTLCVWAMNYLHVFLLADELMGLGLGWKQLGLLCVCLFFSGALLLIPGGVGGLEAAMVMVLNFFGVDHSRAVAAALFARLFYTVPAVAGALLVLACNYFTEAGPNSKKDCEPDSDRTEN